MAEPSWFHPLPKKASHPVSPAGIRKNRVKTVKTVTGGSAVMSGRIQVGTSGSTTRWSATSQSKHAGTISTTGNTQKGALELHYTDRKMAARRLRQQRAMRHRPAGSPQGGQFY